MRTLKMTATERVRTLPATLLREIPRFVLIALFSLAAIDKVIHFNGFVTAVQSYQLLPTSLERSAAVFFIMAEFAIALGLLTKRWRRAACLAAILLLATFTAVYMAVEPVGTCGCWFTLTLNKGGYFHVLQNLVFIALAILTWMDDRSPKPDAYSTSTSTAESDDGRL